MTRYGARHSDATKAAVHKSHRFLGTQRRMTLIIAAVARIGRADQLVPRTTDDGLARTLKLLADSVDLTTDEGAAIVATLARKPKTLGAWVRRNRARVQQILDAQKDNGPPP